MKSSYFWLKKNGVFTQLGCSLREIISIKWRYTMWWLSVKAAWVDGRLESLRHGAVEPSQGRWASFGGRDFTGCQQSPDGNILISCFLLLHFRLEFIELCSHARIHGRSKWSAIDSSFSTNFFAPIFSLRSSCIVILLLIYLCDRRTFAEHKVSSRSALFAQCKIINSRAKKINNNNAIVWTTWNFPRARANVLRAARQYTVD